MAPIYRVHRAGYVCSARRTQPLGQRNRTANPTTQNCASTPLLLGSWHWTGIRCWVWLTANRYGLETSVVQGLGSRSRIPWSIWLTGTIDRQSGAGKDLMVAVWQPSIWLKNLKKPKSIWPAKEDAQEFCRYFVRFAPYRCHAGTTFSIA